MKLQVIKALKRGLALLCISMLILGLLPPQTKARAGEYQFSVFDARQVGTRVYPGDEIRDDYDNTGNPDHKAYLDFTVDGKVIESFTLDYRSVEKAPFFDGVEGSGQGKRDKECVNHEVSRCSRSNAAEGP